MQATDFVESYFDAWNHRDPQAIADHLADDGTYVDVPLHAQRTHDELIISLKDFFSNYRHRYEVIGEILQGQNSVAFQYRMRPHGKGNGACSSDVICGAEFITMRGDTAMNITDYYDIPEMGRQSQPVSITATEIQKNKYAKSGLNEQQLSEYKRRLTEIMQLHQIFLRPDMTLPKLAQAVGCSVNHLSQVINAGFGVSFFDYLNCFRIEHAKTLLSTADGRIGAVLNVAFTVGFNSNSAFYAAFKKCVGQTPAHYRRMQLQKTH